MAASNAPVGVLGGTFDPIHFGHMRLAQELGEILNFSEVRFIPSGNPPHRPAPHATSAHRLAMVKLALDSNPLFTIDEREISRQGPGYTIDTLIELRHELGATRPLCLLLGADAFLDLVTWHRWHELFHFAHLIVAHRPGFPVQTWSQRMPQPLAREYETRHMEQPLAVHLSPAGGIVGQPLAALDIAATRIRELMRTGRSPRYLLPDSVLDYILGHGLYCGNE
jgi:nicotinate-nucleotide adenylyltransferase